MSAENISNSASPEENLLWSGYTSQWVHFWYYFFCMLLGAGIAVGATILALPTGALSFLALLIPAFMWLIRWWVTKCTFYEMTSQRLRIRTGILNKKVDELELFRVKDYTMEQPFLLRLVGLGNLTLITSDATTPTVAIRAISGVEDVREKLRQAVQRERDRKRVRQLDVDSTDDDGQLI